MTKNDGDDSNEDDDEDDATVKPPQVQRSEGRPETKTEKKQTHTQIRRLVRGQPLNNSRCNCKNQISRKTIWS